MPSPATLTVDLNALAHNFHALETVSGAPVHPVVKADAYGLGAIACATRLMAEGARTFFVARLHGGQTLRAALGPEPAIYVLDGCIGDAAPALIAAGLRPLLNHPGQLKAWRAAGGGACGLQIDTGMNRLGFRAEDAPEPFEGLDLVLSHLACADDPTAEMNRRQRDAFEIAARRYPGAVRSFANSGGCFLGPDYAFDAVRPGSWLPGRYAAEVVVTYGDGRQRRVARWRLGGGRQWRRGRRHRWYRRSWWSNRGQRWQRRRQWRQWRGPELDAPDPRQPRHLRSSRSRHHLPDV